MDATAFTTCLGIWVLISPANSTKRLGCPALLAAHAKYHGSTGMQCPPRPGPGSKRENPKGLVDAASTTSWISMPIRSKIILYSLTNAILTARYVFSRSLAASATSAEPTGTTSSHTSAYNATACAPEAESRPPTRRGMDRMGVARPGSSRSGAKAKKKSLPNVRPPEDNSGRQTSRVVPGQVVLSKTTRQPGACTRRIISNVCCTYVRLGCRSSSTGVGTHTNIASHDANAFSSHVG